MVELLIKNRLLKLQQQYQVLKEEATKLMKKGDISHYIQTLAHAEVGQLARAEPEACGKRHAVDVAARGARRRVHVGVCIDPQQADLLAAVPEVLGNAGHGPDRNRVIPADHDRNVPFFERQRRGDAELVAGPRDLI